MPATRAADVFIPEVATEIATATFPERLALGFAGSPFVEGFPPEAMLGEEGDAVKFPRWNPLGSMGALTEDVAMTPERLTSSVDQAVVQVAGKAAEITDWASLAARGDPSEEIGRQMARLAQIYVDSRLIVEAETTSLLTDDSGGSVATYNGFIDALQANWGDKAFEDMGGIIVHSKVLSDMQKTTQWTDMQNTGANASFANRQRGARTPMGLWAGFPVYVSDQLTVGAGPVYDCLILKRGALGLKFQRELLVESDRDILKKSDVIAGDVRFAVHLMYDNPAPVFVWRVD